MMGCSGCNDTGGASYNGHYVNPSTYEARGAAYMYAGRHDDALADYSLAIELDPKTPASGAVVCTPTP